MKNRSTQTHKLTFTPNNLMKFVTSFDSRTDGGEQSDWLVKKTQVPQCRVEHKNNIEPWIALANPIGIPFI